MVRHPTVAVGVEVVVESGVKVVVAMSEIPTAAALVVAGLVAVVAKTGVHPLPELRTKHSSRLWEASECRFS